METLLGCLSGIFIGITTSWYFQIKPMTQLKCENDNLRYENSGLQDELSMTYKKIEMKDEIVVKIKIIINDFMTKEDKLMEIKELVENYQANK